MTKRWNNLSLSEKFSLIIVMFSLFPIILLFSYSNNISYNESIADKKRMLEEKAFILNEKNEKILNLANLSGEVIKGSTSISDYLSKLKNSEEISLQEKLDFNNQEIKSLEKIIISNPYLHHIRIYSKFDGIAEMYPILYSGNRSPYSFDRHYENQWFLDKRDTITSSLDETPLMSLVNTIEVDGEVVGILDVSISMLDVFPDIFEEKQMADFIIKDNQSIIGYYDRTFNPIIDKVKKIDQIDRIKLNSNEDYLVLNQKHEDFEMSYISITALKKLNDMRQTRFISGTLLIIVLTLFLIIVVRKISDQLLTEMYDIFKSIRLFSSGDLSVRPSTYNQKEMKDFSQEVASMFEKTIELIDDNVEKEIAEKNAQIKALQSQINAHFIYNVLENIKMMAEIKGIYEVSDAVTSLGSLLHYSMHWEESFVDLKDEIKYVENYLDLMSLRLNFDLKVVYKIPSHLQNYKMPKLLIQPLVENAILHGLEYQEENTELKIEAFEFREFLIIQVTDYGKGMSMSQLQDVKRNLILDFDIDEKGIGLANVMQRIQIIYGEKYSLDIVSEKNVYTTVILYLPLDEKEAGINE